jgi:hypothetical protein
MFTHRVTKERYAKAQRPIFDLAHDDLVEYETRTSKESEIIVCIYR